MYCAVDEAFDNSLKKQISEYEEKNNNIKKYKLSLQNNFNDNLKHNGMLSPHSFDNYSDIDITQNVKSNNAHYSNMHPVFFTAQGDLNSTNLQNGTSIDELKNNNDNNDNNDNNNDKVEADSFSLPDSNNSDELSIIPKERKKIEHSYYINKFIHDLTDDSVSMTSSNNGEIYEHIKLCKYCKSKINEKMKETYGQKTNKKIQLSEKINNSKLQLPDKINEYFMNINVGYNFKELMIIILSGIVLIFVLDLLVKIGKKMNK